MLSKSSIVFLIAIVTAASAKHLPEGVQTCKRTDFECIAKAATASLKIFKNGNKDLGLPVLDPIYIESIHVAGSGGKIDMEQNYKDVKLYGVSQMKYQAIKPDLDGSNCQLITNSTIPQTSLVGNLELKGKLLLFTIGGNGPCNFTLYDLRIDAVSKCEKITKDGEVYARPVDTQLTLTPKKLTFYVPEIITGNPEMSNNVMKVMDENDLEVFGELKHDFEKLFGQITQKFTTCIFGQIPLKEIFMD